jgi:hypothetical protein
VPRDANATANGEPKTTFPLAGSPSVSSMTVCDQRSTSAISPTGSFVLIAARDSSTVKVGMPIDSTSGMVSEASRDASRARP